MQAVRGDQALTIAADAEDAADQAAAIIADAMVTASAARGSAHWATTGGSTAPALYRRLAATPHLDRIPWDRVHVWWGDDRYVAPDDPRSNVGPLLSDLVGAGVPLPVDQLHPFHGLPSGEPDPGIDEAARATGDELRNSGLEELDGVPVLDIVLLGMGADGHILSVFPGSAALVPAALVPAGALAEPETLERGALAEPAALGPGVLAPSALALAVPAPDHIEPHVARVTFSPRIVAAARLVVVVVTGAGKSDVLGQVLGPDWAPERWPAQLARLPQTRWIIDIAAAAGLAAAGGSAAVAGAIPDRFVRSTDGTPIAVFSSGPADGPPLVMVHGAAADHTTFRVLGPLLAQRYRIHTVDRRGRGASGDGGRGASGRGPQYAIEREFEDLAAVVEAAATETGRRVDVFGHSYGGRIALGAALISEAIGRVVCYEGAPTPSGLSYHDPETERRLEALVARGENDAALALFMAEIVGMSADELAAYRANPVWPIRVAAAPTLIREVRAESSPGASLDALAAVTKPVLLVLGGDSRETFAAATHALEERLPDARIAVIPGARHAAHHTHPAELVAALSEFLLS